MDTLAQRYHVHPDDVLAGDVSVLRRLRILQLAQPPEPPSRRPDWDAEDWGDRGE